MAEVGQTQDALILGFREWQVDSQDNVEDHALASGLASGGQQPGGDRILQVEEPEGGEESTAPN